MNDELHDLSLDLFSMSFKTVDQHFGLVDQHSGLENQKYMAPLAAMTALLGRRHWLRIANAPLAALHTL